MKFRLSERFFWWDGSFASLIRTLVIITSLCTDTLSTCNGSRKKSWILGAHEQAWRTLSLLGQKVQRYQCNASISFISHEWLIMFSWTASLPMPIIRPIFQDIIYDMPSLHTIRLIQICPVLKRSSSINLNPNFTSKMYTLYTMPDEKNPMANCNRSSSLSRRDIEFGSYNMYARIYLQKCFSILDMFTRVIFLFIVTNYIDGRGARVPVHVDVQRSETKNKHF